MNSIICKHIPAAFKLQIISNPFILLFFCNKVEQVHKYPLGNKNWEHIITYHCHAIWNTSRRHYRAKQLSIFTMEMQLSTMNIPHRFCHFISVVVFNIFLPTPTRTTIIIHFHFPWKNFTFLMLAVFIRFLNTKIEELILTLLMIRHWSVSSPLTFIFKTL